MKLSEGVNEANDDDDDDESDLLIEENRCDEIIGVRFVQMASSKWIGFIERVVLEQMIFKLRAPNFGQRVLLIEEYHAIRLPKKRICPL